MASKKEKVALGVGAGVLAAGAAAAAGYYFYGSKDAKKHRRIVAKWATDLKRDVTKQAKAQLKAVKRLDAGTVAQIVDEAAEAYHQVRSINKGDIQKAAAELKQNWQQLEKELRGTVKKAVKKSASNAKKSVRKTTKKNTASKKR